MELAGQVAIVTGAGQGVGRGIALALAGAGARLVICERVAERGEQVRAEIEARGGQALAVPCDVADAADIARAVRQAAARFGRIDILVNNAYGGAVSGNPLAGADERLFIQGFETGPLATWRFMRAVRPHMLAAGGGAIVNVATSGAVRWDMRGYGLYGAVKEGVRVLTRAAAAEWAADGIRVNVIAPLAMTPAMEWWQGEEPEAAKAFFDSSPQRRVGDPEPDIGRAVVFLCSADARFLSGATIPLDGGQARFG